MLRVKTCLIFSLYLLYCVPTFAAFRAEPKVMPEHYPQCVSQRIHKSSEMYLAIDEFDIEGTQFSEKYIQTLRRGFARVLNGRYKSICLKGGNIDLPVQSHIIKPNNIGYECAEALSKEFNIKDIDVRIRLKFSLQSFKLYREWQPSFHFKQMGETLTMTISEAELLACFDALSPDKSYTYQHVYQPGTGTYACKPMQVKEHSSTTSAVLALIGISPNSDSSTLSHAAQSHHWQQVFDLGRAEDVASIKTNHCIDTLVQSSLKSLQACNMIEFQLRLNQRECVDK